MRPLIMKTEIRRKRQSASGSPETLRKPMTIDEFLNEENYDPLAGIPPEELEEFEVIDMDAMLKDGWVTQDINWVATEDWNKVLAWAEGETFLMLAGSVKTEDGKEIRRGQFLWSPEAYEKMRLGAIKYLEENENATREEEQASQGPT